MDHPGGPSVITKVLQSGKERQTGEQPEEDVTEKGTERCNLGVVRF